MTDKTVFPWRVHRKGIATTCVRSGLVVALALVLSGCATRPFTAQEKADLATVVEQANTVYHICIRQSATALDDHITPVYEVATYIEGICRPAWKKSV
ncbi:MAG: hypothetical protein HQL50_16015, partial [Magnetococcales bacterium]|nr:hypothetical protein [Magnetococcales bacterium]